MTQTEPSHQDPGTGSWVTRLIPAATFLVGLILGGVLVFAGGWGGDGDGDEVADDEAIDPSATPSATDGPGDTVVTVPAACEDAADNLQEALTLLRGATDDIQDFKPDNIVDLLNQLEDLDAETRPLVKDCGGVEVSESPG